MYISSPEQWSVLTAPERFEIIEAMRDLAPCGIKAVAQQLGVAPDTLYRHMDLLGKAGYVVPAGFRKVSRATEQLFDLTADDFQIRFDVQSDPGLANEMVRDTAHAFLKRTGQTLDRAADARALNATESGINLTLLNEYVRLSADEFKLLRGLLRQAKQFMDGRRRESAGSSPAQLYNVLLVAVPVISHRTARLQADSNGASKKKNGNNHPAFQGKKNQQPHGLRQRQKEEVTHVSIK